jgi:hypothetical protein
MHAQVIAGGTTPDLRTKMDQIVTDEMIPALRAEPGFAGALNFVNRDNGQAMMIVLWDKEAQAHRELSQYGDAFLRHWQTWPRSQPATASRSRSGK